MTDNALAMPVGLSSFEADRRRSEFGPNAVGEETNNSSAVADRAPLPWTLEAAIALQPAIGELLGAGLLVALLLFGVALGLLQESRTNASLELVKQRLAPQPGVDATVDGRRRPPPNSCQRHCAAFMGCIVPADLELISRHTAADQACKQLIHPAC